MGPKKLFETCQVSKFWEGDSSDIMWGDLMDNIKKQKHCPSNSQLQKIILCESVLRTYLTKND